MTSNEDYGKILRDFTLTLDKFRKGKKEKVNGKDIVYDINNDNAIIKLLSAMSEMYRYQIHEYLVPQESASGEKQIRQYVKDIICDILPIVETKIRVISNTLAKYGRMSATKRSAVLDDIKSLEENRKKYLVLLDDFYALASFRSLKHFALYMEFDKPDSQKVWKHAMGCFESFYFYANSMILDGKVKRITKSFPVGYGKCIDSRTPILTEQGYRPISEVEVGDSVYCMDNNKVALKRVTNKWNTVKPQVKIKVRSGKELICSPEHKLYTDKGYKMCKDINEEDYLYHLCSPIDFGEKNYIFELFFITCMLFDGHCKTNRFRFTHKDDETMDFFKVCLDKLGITYSEKKFSGCSELRIHNTNQKTAEIVAKYGLLDCLSKEKRLPKQFFNMPLRNRYDFIGIMLATDGWINEGKSPCGITLASKELIEDIQRLCESCGIYTYYNERSTHCEGKEFTAYTLTIPDEFFNIIQENCYCFAKDDKARDRMEYLNSLGCKPYCNNVNYPKSVLESCKEFKKENNKRWSKNKSYKRSKVHEFNERTHLLDDVVSNDFVWDKIVSVEYSDEKIPMVDIEVEDVHNFIANGLVSHNSFSDTVAISFIFGFDINNDVLKVVGNNKLIVDTLTGVVGMMTSNRYAKVFPYYAQFNGNKELMFDIGKASEGILLIHGSVRPKSLIVVAKDTAVDGVRAKFRFYDDITRSKDKENVPEHEKDWAKYSDQWSKRKYDDNLDFEIAGGTRYHTEDFLSRYREHYGEEQAVPDKKFKYTMINEKTKFVIISVPKLDPITDESTYPQKFSTESARLERNRDPRTFAAMEQQQPETPLNSPFYWDNLQTYTSLPLKKCEGGNREDTCLASLDLPRTGANNISLGIYSKCENLYYLIDTYYEKKPLDYILPDGRTELDWICDMLIKHNVTELVVEINTCSDIKKQIMDKLLARGYANCKVIEKYSVEKKEVKIMTCWTPIINTIVFPARKVFSLSSMTGRFMQDIIAWNDKAKIDDSIDSVCMFVQEFITKNSGGVGKVSTFRR